MEDNQNLQQNDNDQTKNDFNDSEQNLEKKDEQVIDEQVIDEQQIDPVEQNANINGFEQQRNMEFKINEITKKNIELENRLNEFMTRLDNIENGSYTDSDDNTEAFNDIFNNLEA